MKRFMSVAAVLMAVLMVCSCANGGGSGSESGNAPVKVSFAVETGNDLARVVSVNNPGTTYTYWYAAVPMWDGSEFGNPYGATTAYGQTPTDQQYVQITDYAAGKNIGLFAQGKWTFYARVKNGGNIVYEGNTTDYISVSHKDISVNVSMNPNLSGNATVSLDIEVPDTSATSTVTVSYSGQEPGGFDPIAKNAQAATKGANWSRFTGSEDLAAGSYLFTLTSTDGTGNVGGATLAFDIIPGVDRKISGTMENGVFQATLFTINIPSLNISLSAGGATSVVAGNNLVYTCTATKVNVGGDVSYQWYVNDAEADDGDEDGNPATFTFNKAEAGNYYVTCKAYISGVYSGSVTLPVKVTPAP